MREKERNQFLWIPHVLHASHYPLASRPDIHYVGFEYRSMESRAPLPQLMASRICLRRSLSPFGQLMRSLLPPSFSPSRTMAGLAIRWHLPPSHHHGKQRQINTIFPFSPCLLAVKEEDQCHFSTIFLPPHTRQEATAWLPILQHTVWLWHHFSYSLS